MPATESTRFICLFHDAGRGRSAIEALEDAGFPRNTINVQGSEAGRDDGYETRPIEDLGIPDRDLSHLRDGLSKGGVLVALEAPESRSSEIEGIFHKYSADKIDETEQSATTAAVIPDSDATMADSAVVPVVAEDLIVGKREVDRGGVRVFRRTVEEPVAETVNLHEEHVVVDRRPVDRAVSATDLAAAGQVIELTETAEVPVVTKTARVVEEIRVGLEQSDRTEVIEDTVRHTEVDVQSVPANPSAPPVRR